MKQLEEGDACPNHPTEDFDCDGTLFYPVVEGCTCHISPPCHQCINNLLTCSVCGWEEEK